MMLPHPRISLQVNMFKRFVFTAFAVFIVPAVSAAQSSDTTTLAPLVISASKAPSSRASLSQSVTVISGEELRSRGITRVSEALRSVPGLSVVQNGSTGSVNTLFIRGGESRYTKVLIDGVAVNAPGGFFDFSHLTTDNIERIEVVHGPGSVLYGADAVSGTVQIFTRQGAGAARMSAEAGAGNYGSRETTLESSGGNGIMHFSLGGGARRTNGFLPFNNNYYNGTLSGSAGMTPRPGTDAVVSARYTAAEFHYPTDFTGAPVDSNSYRVQHRLTVGLNAKTNLSQSMSARVFLGSNEVSDLTEDISNAFGGSGVPDSRVHSALLSHNKRRSAEVGLSFRLPESSVLSIGGELVGESETSTDREGPVGGSAIPASQFAADRRNAALYSELIASSAAGATITLSTRRDDNSDYDAFTTYRAGVSMPVGESSRLRASIGTAFNAPAFNQLRPTLFTTGSPGLQPERARSWEIGVEQSFAHNTARISTSYFNQRFSDLIQFVAGGPPDFKGSYANLTEARSNGYEAEVVFTPVTEWSGSLSYSVSKPHATKVPVDFAGDIHVGDALIRRPTHSGYGSLAWARPGTGSLSFAATYAGERPDLDFNQFPSPVVTLPSYVRLDIAGSRQIFRSESRKSALSLTVHVENAMDREYEDVLHYPSPRRTYLIGARYEGGM